MRIGELQVSGNQPIDSVTVSTAVLAKNLDLIEQVGQGMIEMMEQSVAPHLGQNINVRV